MFLAKERIKSFIPILIFSLLILLAVVVMIMSFFMLILSFHPDLIEKLF